MVEAVRRWLVVVGVEWLLTFRIHRVRVGREVGIELHVLLEDHHDISDGTVVAVAILILPARADGRGRRRCGQQRERRDSFPGRAPLVSCTCLAHLASIARTKVVWAAGA